MNLETVKALGRAYALGLAYSHGLAHKGLAADEARWITVHPGGKGPKANGKGNKKGRKALIDSETGEVLGGMGGKFNGRHISSAHKGGDPMSRENLKISRIKSQKAQAAQAQKAQSSKPSKPANTSQTSKPSNEVSKLSDAEITKRMTELGSSIYLPKSTEQEREEYYSLQKEFNRRRDEKSKNLTATSAPKTQANNILKMKAQELKAKAQAQAQANAEPKAQTKEPESKQSFEDVFKQGVTKVERPEGMEEQAKAFAERQKAKRDYRIGRALSAQAAANARFDRIHETYGRMPLGQPMFSGRELARYEKQMQSAVNAQNRADKIANSLSSRPTNAILKKDPEAVYKVQDKVNELTAVHKNMLAVNKDYKKAKTDQERAAVLKKYGLTPEMVAEHKDRTSEKYPVFPMWLIENSRQNLGYYKKRLEKLQPKDKK